ncbi:MAG: winged helix-turn-helix transcriptional regulator [Bacteroidales bacterium]|nr:winged helix-turn-helix transcriptional regulator [Bacteroidales bacterium]
MDATTIKKALHKGEAQLVNKLNLDEVELILPVSIPIENEPKGVTKETEGVTNNSKGVSNGVIIEPEGVSNGLSNTSEGVSNGVSNNSEGVSNKLSEMLSNGTKWIYECIKDNPTINRKEISFKTGISLKNIQKHINKLKSLGILERVGTPNNGYWKIIINNNL